MSNLVNKIFAKIFNNFKTKNPLVAALIISVIIGLKYFIDSGDFLGANETKIDEWVTMILLALTGSHTTAILSEPKEKEKK